MFIWCENCNSKVKVSGPIWANRLAGNAKDPKHPGCYVGWVCDNCANNSESGIDTEY